MHHKNTSVQPSLQLFICWHDCQDDLSSMKPPVASFSFVPGLSVENMNSWPLITGSPVKPEFYDFSPSYRDVF